MLASALRRFLTWMGGPCSGACTNAGPAAKSPMCACSLSTRPCTRRAGGPVLSTGRPVTPGRRVGSPFARLGEPVDVIAYVRAIEEALIRACAEAGLATTLVDGRSGVWVTGAMRSEEDT